MSAALLSTTSYLVASAFRPDLRPILYGASFLSLSILPYTVVVCEYWIALCQMTPGSPTPQQWCPSTTTSSKPPATLARTTERGLTQDWSIDSSVNGASTTTSGYRLVPSLGASARPLSSLPRPALQIVYTSGLPDESPHHSAHFYFLQ